MHTVPGAAADNAPFSPSHMAREALSSATMLIITSRARCRITRRSRHARARFGEAVGFFGVAIKNRQRKSLRQKRRAMPEPMMPRPKNATRGLLIISR